MRGVQIALALILILLLTACSGVSPPVDPANSDKKAGTREPQKIVGTWAFVKSSNNREPSFGTTLEFTTGGKVMMHGPGYANEGQYSVEGGSLKINAATVRETMKIVRLTDKELILEFRTNPIQTDTLEYKKK